MNEYENVCEIIIMSVVMSRLPREVCDILLFFSEANAVTRVTGGVS